MKSGRSFYIICRLTSNLLPHYLVKFDCSSVQPHSIVVQFKSVQSRLFSVNIYGDVMISIVSLMPIHSVAYPPAYKSRFLKWPKSGEKFVKEWVYPLCQRGPGTKCTSLSRY